MEKKYPTFWQTFVIGLLIIWAGAVWKYDFKPEYASWKCSQYDDEGNYVYTAYCEAVSITVQSNKSNQEVTGK